MKHGISKWLGLILILSLSGCGGGEVKQNSENLANSLKEKLQTMGSLTNKVTLPPMPDSTVSQSVEGVDTNHNGTRDDLENIVYQGVNSLDGIDTADYDKVLAVINMIAPKNPPVANSINEHKIYCTYKTLPEVLKDEISLSFLYETVLDTPQRRKAFNDSLQPSTVSSGAETCE